VIVIQANNKRLTFDANRRRFTDNSKPSLYATANTAQERGLELLKKYPKLRGYKMTVEPATATERGAVYGARPRKNPRGKTRGPGSGVTFDEWMTRVDGVVLYLAGVSVHDLPDIPFRDMYDNGSSPSAAAKKAIKRARYDNPRKRELSVFDRHRKKIALDTLKMSDVGARIMGGMTKAEAIEFLQTIGYRFPKR
jgi:hypothetical protein